MNKSLQTTMRMWLWLMVLLSAPAGAWAQVSLPSNGTYTETFDNLGTGLPTGWTVRTGASASNLGTPASFSTTSVLWNNTSGAFKNFASGDIGQSGNQNSATDRSLGVRQTGGFGDPGAAFILQLNNTAGYQNFGLTFKLQSLDASSTRTTTWRVDYGFGAAPTSFSPATAAGTSTTGANQFSNNTITANFGSALDNQSGPVWIRIVAVTASAGSNNRPSTGIDDFNLTYSPAGPVLPTLSINDASVTEGNVGTTTATFTVGLSSPAPAGGVTFDIATADNTATTSDNDYTDNSLTGQIIPAGSSSYTFNVTVIGDANAEATETFFINVTNITGATSGDGQGTGTIQTDDAAGQLAVNGTLNPFSTTQGTPSAAQSYQLTGSGLTNDVTVTAPAGYEVSLNGSTYAGSQNIGQTNGSVSATVFVRLTGASTGSPSGNITNVAGSASVNVAVSGTVSAPTNTIAAIRQQPTGSTVKVRGIVTVDRTFSATADLDLYYIQDATGGIALFVPPANSALYPLFTTRNVRIGNEIQVTGQLSLFNGSYQVQNITNVTVLNSGTTPPTPKVITTAQLNDPANQGLLVQINNSTITEPRQTFVVNTNYAFSDSNGSSILRLRRGINDLVNSIKPSGPTNLVGILDFFNTTPQLYPRFQADIPGTTERTQNDGGIANRALTLDVTTWNIEWLGNTAAGFGPILSGPNDAKQIANVPKVLQYLNSDVFVTPEISGPSALSTAVNSLNSATGRSYVAVCPTATGGAYAAPDAQRVCFVYDQAVFTGTPTLSVLTSGFNCADWGSTGCRLPVQLSGNVTINGVTRMVNFIGIHAKSGSNQGDYNDRVAASNQLKSYMDARPNQAFIVLGDFNDDLDASIYNNATSPYNNFTTDANDYRFITRTLTDEQYTTTLGFDNPIDHILISNELFSEYVNNTVGTISPDVLAPNFLNNADEFGLETSDHVPVFARFNLGNPPATPLALTLTANPTQILTTGTTTLSATVSNGTTPYTYAFIGPATSTILPNGNTATISDLSAGVQTFTVVATDATTPTSQTISATVSVTVTQANQAPTVASAIANQTATVGQDFNFVIPANTFADDAGVVSVAVTDLPAGLRFEGSTTAISGTPTTAGISSVTVTATDAGNLSVSTSFSVTVNPVPVAPLALTFTASPTQILTTSTTTLSATVSGGTTPYNYVFAGPGTIAQNDNTATVSGLSAGVQTFTVTVTDATSPTSQTISGTVSVTVTELTPTPQADLSVSLTDSPDPVTVNSSLTYSFTVTNAGPADASNVSIQLPLPAGTTFASLNSPNGFNATTPAVGQGGTIDISTANFSAGSTANFTLVVTPTVVTPSLITTVNVTAGDATVDPNSANNVASVTTSVLAANTAPTTAGIINQTTTVGEPFSLNVASAFTDAETPNALTLVASGLPTDLTLTNGFISGTPSTTSVSQVTVTATDPGSLTTSATFTLTVNAPTSMTSTAPFAITGVTTVSCETLRSDLRRVTFAPQYAGLTGQPLSFSVVNELRATTQPGPYTLNLYIDNPVITLQAVQGGSQSSFIYNWLAACGTTAPTNQAPTVANPIATQTATASQPFSLVIPTGTFADDADASLLTLSVTGLPAGLNYTAGNKTISGTPTTAGTSSVTVMATDEGNLSASTSFVLIVNDPGTTAPFAITGVTTVSCMTLTADQRQLTFTPQYTGLTGQPVSFSVVNELPATTQSGPYTLKLYTDNPNITLQAVQAGTQSSFVYNWLAACGTTAPANQAPTVAAPIANQTATVNQPFSLVIPTGTFADDADAALLSVSVTGLPANLSFDTATKTINGTPTGSGTSLVTVAATDAGNLSVSTSFVLTVNDPSSTAPFAITGVTTVNCETLRADLRRVTFTPQYAGLTGQPVSFSVVNEMPATTNVGPYALNLYTDNPTISLQAVQGSVQSSFTYNWLTACGSNPNARVAAEQQAPLTVTVLGNPTTSETVTVEVRGATGQSLQLRVTDLQGQTLSEQNVQQAASVEQHQLRLGRATGLYLLQVNTPTKTKVVKVVRQ